MTFYRYLEERNVHVLDCSGIVDLELGRARLEFLQEKLASCPAERGPHKLLIDFRRTVWADEDTHRQLSVATRRDFGLHPDNVALKAAFLHPTMARAIAPNEAWFTDEDTALAWLDATRADALC